MRGLSEESNSPRSARRTRRCCQFGYSFDFTVWVCWKGRRGCFVASAGYLGAVLMSWVLRGFVHVSYRLGNRVAVAVAPAVLRQICPFGLN